MKMRYVQPKAQIPSVDLDRAIAAYHEQLETMRQDHNLKFAPMFRPFHWPQPNEEKAR